MMLRGYQRAEKVEAAACSHCCSGIYNDGLQHDNCATSCSSGTFSSIDCSRLDGLSRAACIRGVNLRHQIGPDGSCPSSGQLWNNGLLERSLMNSEAERSLLQVEGSSSMGYMAAAVALMGFVILLVLSACDKKDGQVKKGQMQAVRFGDNGKKANIKKTSSSTSNRNKSANQVEAPPLPEADEEEINFTPKKVEVDLPGAPMTQKELLEADLMAGITVVNTSQELKMKKSPTNITNNRLSLEEEVKRISLTEKLIPLPPPPDISEIEVEIDELDDDDDEAEEEEKSMKVIQMTLPPPPKKGEDINIDDLERHDALTLKRKKKVSILEEDVASEIEDLEKSRTGIQEISITDGKEMAKEDARPSSKYIKEVSRTERPESIFRPSTEFIQLHKDDSKTLSRSNKNAGGATSNFAEVKP